MEGVVVVVVVRKGLLRRLMLLKWGIRKSAKEDLTLDIDVLPC